VAEHARATDPGPGVGPESGNYEASTTYYYDAIGGDPLARGTDLAFIDWRLLAPVDRNACGTRAGVCGHLAVGGWWFANRTQAARYACEHELIDNPHELIDNPQVDH
jgi:hypothetical protein